MVVEQMPEYPGGMAALMKFIAQNIRYPKEAQEKGIQGRVIVQVTIDETGKINNPTIVKSISPEIDAEAIRIVKAMPNWTPGKQRGKAVSVKYTLPLNFSLSTGEKKEQKRTIKKQDENGVYLVPDKMPEFPGGMVALNKFISSQLEYPKVAHENGISGRVIVQTIITKEGKITEPKVVKSVSPELDAEALRVVKLMPNWNPGKQRGIAVNVKYNIPFTFSLQ